MRTNIKTKLGTLNAVVSLPESYDLNPSSKYPVIYFFPGTGEVGTDVNKLLIYGPNKYIQDGWNGIVNGHEYIIISIQPTGLYPRPSQIKPSVDLAESTYRIDKTKVCMTGLSMGGWTSNIFATNKDTPTDFSYMRSVNCVVNVQGVTPDDTFNNTTLFPAKFAEYAQKGGKELVLEQTNDYRSGEKIAKAMNDAVAGSCDLVYTTFGTGNHCCWQEVYGGNWKLNNKNVYDYIDSYLFGNVVTPVNMKPVVNAGTDQSISVKNVTLIGTASDSDGTIVSTKWEVISGNGIIAAQANLNTSVSGLSEGVNTFRLSATDDKGAISFDDILVTVTTPIPPTPVRKAIITLFDDSTWEYIK